MKTDTKNFTIWVEGLEISYSLKNINFAAEKGELVGMTGLNQDDKKMLFEVLGCFHKPRNGKYIFDYVDINLVESARLEAIRAEKIGYVFDTPKLFDELNVIQNVTLWLDYFYPKKSSYRLAKDMLKEFDMEEKSQSCIEQLSSLEKVKVSLARAAIKKPELLLIDDIFSWLKPEDSETIMRLLLKLAEKEITTVFFTNIQEFLLIANRVIRFEGYV